MFKIVRALGAERHGFVRRSAQLMAAATFVLTTSTLGCGESESGGSSKAQEASVKVVKAALEDKNYYYRLGKRVDVTVPSDQLLVVTRQKGQREFMANLAKTFGASIDSVYQENFFVLRVQKALSRPELEVLADAIKQKAQGQVAESGLVMLESPNGGPTLLPGQFIAKFDAKLSRAEIDDFNAKHDVELVGPDMLVKNQFVLHLKPGSAASVLTMSADYQEDELVEFAHPNFWRLHMPFDQTPFDPFFGNQWHHKNTGQSAGLVDADADTSWAWDFGFGSPEITIGVVDQGVQTDHPDLAANIFTNAAETAGNGIDDDGNGLIDDVHGWDFSSCGGSPLPCGDNDGNPVTADDNHGTAVAGVAAARANNATGVAGGCPNCKIVPLRIDFSTLSDQGIVNVFEYIATMGFNVVNNSWGHSFPTASVSTAVANAIADAANAGSMILFAAGNGDYSDWCIASYPSLNDSVMAVSSSTNLDKKVTEAAWGDCVDILAPSHRGYEEPYNGTLNITTTDRTGTTGYNNASPPPLTCAIAEPANTDYTHCFGGTSSATPLVAGIAGLIMSSNISLSRTEVQTLIQDTADKIVPSVANYDANTGHSTPLTHSWGRVNAYEAVRVAATSGTNARNDIDVFFRDNELDWGNATSYLGEQASNVKFESPRTGMAHWTSRDIKVDAPPYQTPPTAATYDAFIDEKPSLASGAINKVYVRIRNRGHDTAYNVNIKLMWTQFGTSLPAMPSDFWTSFPNDSSSATNPWTSASCEGLSTPYCTVGTVSYSGASVAGTPSDAAQIAAYDMPAPTYDPSKANHFCLLAIADSNDDHVDPISTGIFNADGVTPNDNNVTHRNYTDLDTSVTGMFDVPFYIRNPFPREMRTKLTLSGDPKLLASVRTQIEGFAFDKVFTMGPYSEKLVKIHLVASRKVFGNLDIAQQNFVKNAFVTVGGLTLGVVPGPMKPQQ